MFSQPMEEMTEEDYNESVVRYNINIPQRNKQIVIRKGITYHNYYNI